MNMEKAFLDENIPPGVAVAFTGLVRKAVGASEGLTKSQCREADKAAELQAELGPAAILRGHHHVSWVTAIMHTYRRRTYPPGTDKSKRKVDKSALELSAVLVRECWNLFENVWAVRNDILHRENSAGANMTSKHLTEELLDIKYNATEYLRPEDRGQIDYPDAVIMRWTIKHKERMLKMLRDLRRQYQLELALDAKRQSVLTKFGFTIERPVCSLSNSTHPRRRRRIWLTRRGWLRRPANNLVGAVT